MDFLNKTFAQFSDLFRSMTPGARITAGLLLAVVVISLVYLFSYQMSPSDSYLMGGQAFKPDQLHRIQSALGAKNLTCTTDGMKVIIPSGREAEYMAALAEGNAIPAGWGDPDASIASGSVFEDPSTRNLRAKSGLEKKLGFWVSSLPNVENAAVTFDKSSGSGFRKKVSICASVVVKPAGDNIELPKRTVASIRNMVASAISPMNPSDVTVVNLGTGTSYAADNDANSGAFGVEYLETTRNWEEDYTGKISNLLARIDGVKVAVTVRLDPTKSMAATMFKPDKKETVAVTTTTTDITRDQEGPVPNGRPGIVSNQPAAIRSPAGRGSKENESESKSSTTNLVGQTSESKTSVGMTPQWVAASIVVPHSYLVKVWKQEHPPVEGAEVKQPETKDIQPIEQRVTSQIKEVVAGVLPDMKDVADKTAQVKVTVDRDIRPDPLPEPAMTSAAMTWLSANWQMIGLVVLAFASLGILRSMIKSTPLESSATQKPGIALTVETGASGNEGGEEGASRQQQRRLARFAAGGASLRDELSVLIQEDPDAAANILRTWIGSPTMKV